MNPKEKKKSCYVLFQHSFHCLNAYMQFTSVPTVCWLLLDGFLLSCFLLSGLTCSYTCMPAAEKTAVAQRCSAHVISEWSKHEFTMRHTALRLMFPVM